MIGSLDRDWVETVKAHLHATQIDPYSEQVKRVLGPEAGPVDGFSDQGLNFALALKDKYKEGQDLSIPSANGWLIAPEHLTNNGLRLGHFEDTLVLSMMTARDPSLVVSLGALARVAPRSVKRGVVADVLVEIAKSAAHDDVQDCIDFLKGKSFRADSVEELRRIIGSKITNFRSGCYGDLTHGLKGLLGGDMSSASFIKLFFDRAEKSRLRTDIYSSMVITLIKSPKVRPMVKLLVLDNMARMPHQVQLQVTSAIGEMSKEPAQAYLKRELLHVLEAQKKAKAETADRAKAVAKILH